MARSLQGCNPRSMYTVPFDAAIFRVIPGHREYVINNDGTVIKRIASDKTIRKPQLTIWPQTHKGKPTRYLYASIATKDALDVNGEIYDSGSSPVAVHRLVALAWCENTDPVNNVWVNHKNGIKEDCRHTNLEWGTISYNIQHAVNTRLRVAPAGKDHYNYGKHLSANTKQLMREQKLGVNHPRFKGWYITPAGKFASSHAAAIANGTYNIAVIRRCNSYRWRHLGWSFEPAGHNAHPPEQITPLQESRKQREQRLLALVRGIRSRK